MTMTMDHQSNRHLGGGMAFDHLPYGNGPSFNNPWQHPSPSNTHLYSSSLNANPMGFDALAKQAQKPSTTSMSYPSGPAPSSLSGTGGFASSQYDSSNLVNMSQELLNSAQQGYSAPSANVGTYAPTSMSFSSPFGSVPAPAEPRRLSQGSSVAPHPPQSFSDALDASRSMVAMSGQDLTTPRNIYDARERDSSEGYGFPAPHSPHSSISGASYAGSYASYAPSVDSSVSDYGSQSDLESVHSRTLPRPTSLMASSAGSLPPPQSMMGQFNSKISSSTQKKHKCKVCDKRFTRPSSLQTHMYSHTGEKPYACDAEGCGRHFSVVSNLRRHRKVHKSDRSDHESPEGSWSSEK